MPSTNSSNNRSTVLAAFLIGAALSGCAAKQPPTLSAAPSSALDVLRADLSSIFQAAQFDRAMWAVAVRSVDTGEELFGLNSTKLMMPASNQKILTLAASAERLGWDYRFETRIVSCAPIEEGSLKGDLVVVGGGDPTIGDRSADAAGGRLFEKWAAALAAAGISTIDGRVVGDDRLFEDDHIGAGWAWDDLAYSDAAPVTPLIFDSNAAELVVRPGSSAGELAFLAVRPIESGLSVENHVVTSAAGTTVALTLRRGPGTSRLIARGAVPLGTPEFARTVSVDDPNDFFVTSLRRVLTEHGITVKALTHEREDTSALPDVSGCRVLIVHRSAPLSELAVPMMRLSLNLYAETLLRVLAASAAFHAAPPESPERQGLQVLRDVFRQWGITPETMVLSDASGLSRYNYVSVGSVASVLTHIARDARHAAPFAATLPVAGQDGTLANRMKGTPAEGNARAKTGSISAVRALSGYVHTKDGEQLGFSIMINGSNLPASQVDEATDRAVARLAEFSRNRESGKIGK